MLAPEPQPYRTPIDQAWLRFWVGIHGQDSLLAPYLTSDSLPTPYIAPMPDKKPHQTVTRRPRAKRTPEERVANKIERESKKFADMPLPDWAKNLIGDRRISGINLDDILAGIDDYFGVFEQMRRVNPQAYAYFSRVGAPIIMHGMGVWKSQVDIQKVMNASSLPSYFGVFFTRTEDEHRDEVIKDKPCLPEFIYFEKIKNATTVAPYGTTVFSHNEIMLKRDIFSKEELRKFPWGGRNMGIWWYVGVLPDGTLKALPCRMTHYQRLPTPRRSSERGRGGGGVHTSRFQVPEGLVEMGHGDADDAARKHFLAAVAFAAAASSGLQVTIRKDLTTARFGIPITAAKEFFADRESGDGQRRKAILHLRAAHERTLRDGRVVWVGGHLSGNRQFGWKGYQITIGAPGIHYPSPEGLSAPVYDMTGPLSDDNPSDLMPVEHVVGKLEEIVWKKRPHRRFRRGEPVAPYQGNTIEPSDAA